LRNLIIQLLQAMSEGENILQCIKEALILHENFNPVVLFERLFCADLAFPGRSSASPRRI
jgi:hypothetical protein